MKSLKVGMLGCGTVGSQIARLLVANKADLTSRAGAQIELLRTSRGGLTFGGLLEQDVIEVFGMLWVARIQTQIDDGR